MFVQVRAAQDALLQRGISLALNVKRSMLDRVACRCVAASDWADSAELRLAKAPARQLKSHAGWWYQAGLVHMACLWTDTSGCRCTVQDARRL